MTTTAAQHDARQPSTVIRAWGVRKAYRNGATVTPVLDGVDLQVRVGECVYLAGPSGSGKTTLLSILGCILTADDGRVEILERDVSRLSALGRSRLRLEKLGFVFQRFHLIKGLTVLENVCVPLVLRGVPTAVARRRAAEMLEIVGLAQQARASVQNLSAGQSQRVAIARALVGDPQIILADEPTASLDGPNGQQVMTLLRRLVIQQQRTAVVVTHDPRIFRFADRILHLENGRIARCEVPQKPDSVPQADTYRPPATLEQEGTGQAVAALAGAAQLAAAQENAAQLAAAQDKTERLEAAQVGSTQVAAAQLAAAQVDGEPDGSGQPAMLTAGV